MFEKKSILIIGDHDIVIWALKVIHQGEVFRRRYPFLSHFFKWHVTSQGK